MRSFKVFAVYDSKVEAYLSPFIMQTRGQALRAFTDTVNDPNTNFFKHPEDYTLFEIGDWDEQSGSYVMHPAKTSLGVAIEFKKEDALIKASKPEWSPALKTIGVNA